jgi:hypothetical protein
MTDPSPPRAPEGMTPRAPEGMTPRAPEGMTSRATEGAAPRQTDGVTPRAPETGLAAPAAVPPPALVPETGPVPFPQNPDTEAVPAPPRTRGIAGWALAVAIVGLAASLFVGWGFPLGIVAVVAAGMALQRAGESRQIAGWALALGILSLIHSVIWIAWAASQATLFA